jgi:hypothetical protein
MTFLLLLLTGLQDAGKTTYEHTASIYVLSSKEVAASEELEVLASGFSSIFKTETKEASAGIYTFSGTTTLKASWAEKVLSVEWSNDLAIKIDKESGSWRQKLAITVNEKTVTWKGTRNGKAVKGSI